MSKQMLKGLTDTIFDKIKKKSDIYRKEFVNLETHTVVLELEEVKEQCWLEMTLREGYTSPEEFKTAIANKNVEELERAIDTHVPTLLSRYYTLITAQARGEADALVRVEMDEGSTPTNYGFAVYQLDGGTQQIYRYIKGLKSKGGFGPGKDSTAQKPLLDAISAWAEKGSRRGEDIKPKEGEKLTPAQKKFNRQAGAAVRARSGKVAPGSKTIRAKDSFLDFSHLDDSSISNLRTLHAVGLLEGFAGSFTRRQRAAKRIAKRLRKTYRINADDIKNYQKHTKKVGMTLHSSRWNEASQDRGEVKFLEDTLMDAAEEASGGDAWYWVLLRGSDSFFDMSEKIVVNAYANNSKIKKNPKITVQTKVKYTDRKNSTTAAEGKKRKRTVNSVKIGALAYKKPRKGQKPSKTGGVAGSASSMTETAAMSPLHMIGLINKELPAVVENNMGRPRLESQTGDFARSVELTDVITTPQGFPSFGYTYDLDPYKTFEVGGAQGSRDYDPRPLIDRSIRQVAAKAAMGRFYTRRVG